MGENTTDGSTLHLLPADAYPGLLDGWCGPVLAKDITRTDGYWPGTIVETVNGEVRVYRAGAFERRCGPLRLDIHRPECIDRVVRVLAAGVWCDRWTGDGCDAASDCTACDGTGYRIQPADLSWARDLPPWQAGPILAASVLRVAAGEDPVRRVAHMGSIDSLFSDDGRYYLSLGYALCCAGLTLIPTVGGAVARVEAP